MKKLFLISATLVFAMFGLFTSCSDDGEVSETNADNSSCSLSSFTKVTDISELDGKILESSQTGWYVSYGDYSTNSSSKGIKDYGTTKNYYVFSNNSVIKYRYDYSSVTRKLADVDKYTYEFEEGRITDENGEEYIGTVYSKDDKYYIIDEETVVLPRKSGSGLCATFGMANSGDDYSYERSITFYTDGTISGKSTSKSNEDENEYSENNFYTGTYKNNNGILSCDMKIVSVDSEDRTTTAQVDGGFLYDGSSLYSLDAFIVISALPEDTTTSN